MRDRIRSLLADGRARTCREIGAELGIMAARAHFIVRHLEDVLRIPGPPTSKRAREEGYRRGRGSLWRLDPNFQFRSYQP
jgi:hypothetical protein